MKAFELTAEKRTAHGRAENRRLRRAGKVPAIMYGGNDEPMMLSVEHNDLAHHLENDAFFSHVIKVKVAGGASEEVVLRDLQRHPSRPFIQHMDLLRVVAGEVLRMNVPLFFVGQDVAPGVVEEDGVFQHNVNDVEVECLPRDLPQHIEVDCSAMALHDAIHMSDLKMPEGVQLVELMQEDAADRAVVSVQVPRAAIELEQEEAAEAEAAAAAEAAEAEAAGEAGEGEAPEEGEQAGGADESEEEGGDEDK